MPKIVSINSVLATNGAKDVPASKEPEHFPPAGWLDKWNAMPFAWEIVYCRENRQAVTEALYGQIVVDLGSGKNIAMYRICCLANAQAYIAVDKHHIPILRENILSDKFWQKDFETYSDNPMVKEILMHPKDVPIVLIQEDMLEFLKKVPSDSVSITASGLDACMLDEESYINNLETEIERTLRPDGAFISYRSVLFRKSSKSFTSHQINEYLRICKKTH